MCSRVARRDEGGWRDNYYHRGDAWEAPPWERDESDWYGGPLGEKVRGQPWRAATAERQHEPPRAADHDSGAVRCGPCGFDGRTVNVVQVGLGTNATFIQNIGAPEEWDRSIHWMMRCVSEQRPGSITGIGVEPVEEHVQNLQRGPALKAPGVAVVCAAIGESDTRGVEVHALARKNHDDLLQRVQPCEREDLRRYLQYLQNMSCVGEAHPDFFHQQRFLHRQYGVWVDLDRVQTDVWTWAKLRWQLNFGGCELLIVDAEGNDAAVLRSMLAHCKERQRCGVSEWPNVIQFETMGNCDKLEGWSAEWDIIKTLEREGYVNVHFSNYNSHLAWGEALKSNKFVREWAESFCCAKCHSYHKYPYVTNSGVEALCIRCSREG